MPSEYLKHALTLRIGQICSPRAIAARLHDIHYSQFHYSPDSSPARTDASEKREAGHDWDEEEAEVTRGHFSLQLEPRLNQSGEPDGEAGAVIEVGPAHTEDVYTLSFRTLESLVHGTCSEAPVDDSRANWKDMGLIHDGNMNETRMGIVNITARRSRRESRRSLNSSHVLAVAIATIATDYFTMVFYLCTRYLQACEHER